MVEILKEIAPYVVGGGGYGLFQWWYSRRKAKAEAGTMEADLDKARMEVEKLKNQANKEQMLELLDEAKELRNAVNVWVKKATNFEIKLLAMTRRAELAEAELEKTRCTVIGCCMRIPPNGECRVELTIPKRKKKDEVNAQMPEDGTVQ